jgi:sugar-phosphatase
MNDGIGIIFDMDGVLIDSEPSWQHAEIQVLGALGVPLNSQQVQATTGWRIDRVVEYWRKQYPFGGDTQQIADTITQAVATQVRAEGRPLPGARELLAACHEEGLPIGLATSSSPVLIDAVLDRLEIRSFFGAIASASEVPLGKPDPAVYLLCAQRLGLRAQQCIAIEDSRSGIGSAIRAGMRCLAVQEERTSREAALEAGAHAWVESLLSIGPETLRALAQ